MTKGQVWRDQDGVLWEVDWRDGEEACVFLAHFKRTDPDRHVTRVDVRRFVASHRLVKEADGSPAPPTPAPEFRVGDVVRLRCGGPPMVVASIGHDVSEGRLGVRLSWHLADGSIGSGVVPNVLLVPAPSAAADVVSEHFASEKVEFPRAEMYEKFEELLNRK